MRRRNNRPRLGRRGGPIDVSLGWLVDLTGSTSLGSAFGSLGLTVPVNTG